MKRKILATTLIGAMAAALAACGGGTESASTNSGTTESAATESKTTETSGGDYDLRLVNGKIEVDAQLKNLAAAYEKETGVKVQIESMGGGIDIQGTLKGYYQADNMPDIFVNGGDTDFANWDGLLVDMSGEAWVDDTEAEYVSADGKVLGFPYTTEAIGLAYNADILEKAGIDPASITSPDALKAMFETIDAKKDELGLTAVIGYCAEATNLYWSTGNHLFGIYEDGGLERDDTTYFDLLSDGGKIDAERFAAYAEMIALFNQYSDPSLLVSGTYDQQILNFASGKYAFVTQGSWIGATMTSDDADAYAEAGNFKVGMLPYAFLDGIDTIQTNSPSWWAVFDNDNAQKAKDFLAWCAGDAGQKILVEEAGFISPFTSCSYVAADPFAETISSYTAAGKTSAWHWLGNKEGLAQNALGVVYQDFASGGLDTEGFCNAVAQVCSQYYAS
ncbi:MAG: ABC transporter substrate-binding protein [Lachnospiraceae bacterium]|nr:ABC transporter substrate-binding protein [Lachnospiraceae bacterium]